MRWLEYWRTVKARVVWDRGLSRGAWIVPWLAWRARARRKSPVARLAFYPQPAGIWYTLRLALIGSGVRVVRRVEDADIIMRFDDRTDVSDAPWPITKPTLNRDITDISKARVATVFKDIFGYDLSVDPTTFSGRMAVKSDVNGVHDGRAVRGPINDPDPSLTYQKLIDTECRPGVMEELRCTCVGGRVSAVVRKEKTVKDRFSATYLTTHPVDPSCALSPDEHETLCAFLGAMGLDFGSIDVLRERHDGRIYVVDVNKTCMPVLAMNWRDLDRVLAQIGDAAETMIMTRVESET
jgi:hypothetical protein